MADRALFSGPQAAAAAVAPTVAGGRGWGEVHARLAPETVSALARAGLFRLVAPREVGGWEASLPEQLAVHELLGAADPSAAWCVTNSAVIGRAAAYLSDDACAAVFADPEASFAFSNLVAGEAIPLADGSYRLAGRWSVVSGAAHADWAVLGAHIRIPSEADQPQQVRWMLVPARAWQVEETWRDANAMIGTGSHTLHVTDHVVAANLAHSWDRPRRLDRPLYRLTTTSVTGASTAAICLGVLGSALAELTELLGGYRSALDGASPRDWPNVTETVADLSARLRAARAGLFEAAEAVWACVTGGDAVPPARRAELFASADHAVATTLAGVSRAYVCGTGRALQRGHPLDRALRDAHGMAVNWERIRRMIFDAGRVLLGAEPGYRSM